MVFFLLSSLLVIGVLVVIARSWRKSVDDAHHTLASREAANVQVARDRFNEIQALGLEDSDKQAVLEELTAELAEDTRHSPHRKRDDAVTAPWVALGLGCVLLVGSGALYLSLGSPEHLYRVESTEVRTSVTPRSTGENDSAALNSMIDSLARRLQSEPDDADGWMMLARSYLATGRYDDAVTSLQQFRRLRGDTPELLSQIVDAMAMVKNGAITGDASVLLDTAYDLDQNFPRTLWLAATRARQNGEFAQALEFLRDLQRNLADDDTSAIEQVSAVIAQTQLELQGSESDEANGAQSDAAYPLADETAEAATQASIKLKIVVGEKMQIGLHGSEVVYVYARAASGPPMPLAVKTFSLSELPANVTLGVENAMMPNLSIKDFDHIVVGARVSLTGDARATSGDREGEAGPVQWRGAGEIEVEINRLIQ